MNIKLHIIWVALPVRRYLSNAASFVFYGIACLMRLIEVTALFATFEENMCQTSSVRQVVPPDHLSSKQRGPNPNKSSLMRKQCCKRRLESLIYYICTLSLSY